MNSFLRKPSLVWVIANVVGVGILPAVFAIYPGTLPITGLVAGIVQLSIPISIAQWSVLAWLGHRINLWVLTFPAGAALLALIMVGTPDSLWGFAGSDAGVVGLIGLILGLLVSFPQWILLRGRFPHASLWITATVIGLAPGAWFVVEIGLLDRSGLLSLVLVTLAYAVPTGLVLERMLSRSVAMAPVRYGGP